MHDLDPQQLERYEDEGPLGEYAGGYATESQEMELAAEFLEISSEMELEQFLGRLLRRAKAAAGRAYDSPFVQQRVIPALKAAATYFAPVPVGGDPAPAAAAPPLADQLLSAELEGLTGEDREFEVARRYVRLADDTLQRALQAPAQVPPPVAAQIVLSEAARAHAPGLVPFVPALVGQAARPYDASSSRMGAQETFETYEAGYELYEGEDEDEQFVGNILRSAAPPTPGVAGGLLGAHGSVSEGPLTETQEMELTAELLEIASEEELEEFLGSIFKGVAKSVGGAIGPDVGKSLGGVLKGVAKVALPIAGGALGSFVAPGVGTAIGSKLGAMASNLFEMELEGMTGEQAEFEVGRRYVRLAAASAAHAATAPPNTPPAQVARAAFRRAARRYARGLLRTSAGASRPRRSRQAARRRRPSDRPLGAAAFPLAVYMGNGSDGGGGEPLDEPLDEPDFAEPSDSETRRGGGRGRGREQSGRWIRRGGTIILLGV